MQYFSPSASRKNASEKSFLIEFREFPQYFLETIKTLFLSHKLNNTCQKINAHQDTTVIKRFYWNSIYWKS